MSTLHRRTYGAAVVGVLLAVGAAGCNGDDTSASGVPLDRATGAVLADAADRLADALEGGDPCRALAEAEALEERARGAVAEDQAPEAVVAEAIRVVDATTVGLTCQDDGSDLAGDAEVAPERLDDAAADDVDAGDDGGTEHATSDDGTVAADTSAEGSSTARQERDTAGPPPDAGPPGDRGRGQGRGDGRGRG